MDQDKKLAIIPPQPWVAFIHMVNGERVVIPLFEHPQHVGGVVSSSASSSVELNSVSIGRLIQLRVACY